MKLTVPVPKPRAKRVVEKSPPRRQDPLGWASFQPPTLDEWNQFVSENFDLIARFTATAGENDSGTSEISNPNNQGNEDMKLKMTGLPIGAYPATFNEIETMNHPEYGDGLAWKFTVDSGQFAGQQASRITGVAPTAKNACGKILKGIAGRLPDVGKEVDLAAYYGKKYQIIVEETESGSTRIGAVLPVSEGGN